MRRRRGQTQDYLKHKENVRVLIKERLQHFNIHYKYQIGRISIRNQRTRWGSCSSKGNLNFNYRIIKLPAEYQDYIIVHELCHIKQMNHSSKFWALVSETIPNYKEITKELRGIIIK